LGEGKRNLLGDLDKKILEALDHDARVSLKNMGKALGVTHTTMYNHLARLTEMGIIKACTVDVDPEFINTKSLHFYEIHTLKSGNAELDKVSARAYADYLMQAYGDSIIFCSVGDTNRVYVITHFLSEEQEARMRADLESNKAFVEGFAVSNETKIMKGFRLLSYNRFNSP
jgi:DNA-binding Lrp family transcriptional regulator